MIYPHLLNDGKQEGFSDISNKNHGLWLLITGSVYDLVLSTIEVMLMDKN